MVLAGSEERTHISLQLLLVLQCLTHVEECAGRAANNKQCDLNRKARVVRETATQRRAKKKADDRARDAAAVCHFGNVIAVCRSGRAPHLTTTAAANTVTRASAATEFVACSC